MSRSPAGISGVCGYRVAAAVPETFLCDLPTFRLTVNGLYQRSRDVTRRGHDAFSAAVLRDLVVRLSYVLSLLSSLRTFLDMVRCSGTSRCWGTILTLLTSCQCLRLPRELVSLCVELPTDQLFKSAIHGRRDPPNKAGGRSQTQIALSCTPWYGNLMEDRCYGVGYTC